MIEPAEASGTGVERVPASRDESFVDYVRRREQSLLRTAYLLTGDVHHAEDLLQTALTDLFRSWDKITDPGSVDGYVRRILVNANNSAWRKSWRRREIPATDLFTDPVERFQPTTDDPATRNTVWEQVQTLPPKQRVVIVLRYYEDLAVDTIADLMGISPGTVKSQANRALATLRANPELADLEDWS